MLLTLNFLLLLRFYGTYCHREPHNGRRDQTLGPEHASRRILKGQEVFDTRAYMVYLRAVASSTHKHPDPNWICGGVIVHPRYILTSAACIEDVMHFHIVAGTHKLVPLFSKLQLNDGNHEELRELLKYIRWVPTGETSDCIANGGAVRAVWKCVPKTYRYDGFAFNNIRWMANDVAVVMTERPFNFKKRVKGCDFIPQIIRYNNQSEDLESPGSRGSIAGWGSTHEYADTAEVITRTNINAPILREADVMIIPKATCKSLWMQRYEEIIDQYMICGKSIHLQEMTQACEDNQLDCRQLIYSEEEGGSVRLNREGKASDRRLLTSLARVKKLQKARRKSLRRDGGGIGGFCENDHGGPLVVGHGSISTVIGIISAYKTMNNSRRCIGPFLYTSVYKNRHLINCAIYKEMGTKCTAVLRTSSTVLDVENIDWPQEQLKLTSNKKRGKKDNHHNSTRKSKSTRKHLISWKDN